MGLDSVVKTSVGECGEEQRAEMTVRDTGQQQQQLRLPSPPPHPASSPPTSCTGKMLSIPPRAFYPRLDLMVHTLMMANDSCKFIHNRNRF